jgi:hypothetical protein
MTCGFSQIIGQIRIICLICEWAHQEQQVHVTMLGNFRIWRLYLCKKYVSKMKKIIFAITTKLFTSTSDYAYNMEIGDTLFYIDAESADEYRIFHFFSITFVIFFASMSYIIITSSTHCVITYFCDMNLNYQLNPYLFISICILFILSYISLHFTRRIIYKFCFFILLTIIVGITSYNVWCYHYYISIAAFGKGDREGYLCTLDRKEQIRSFRILPGRSIYDDYYNYTYDTNNIYSVELDVFANSLIREFLPSLGIYNDQKYCQIYMSPTSPNFICDSIFFIHGRILERTIYLVTSTWFVFLMNLVLLFAFSLPNNDQK